MSPEPRSKGKRKWRTPTDKERISIRNTIWARTPDIVYFPSFVFDFPDKFFLTSRGGTLDGFYRRVFQDILDYDGHGHTIEDDITNRVRTNELTVPWMSFLSLWNSHDDRRKIQHVMDRASAAVTKLVFGRWNKIFKEEVRGKEVVITYDFDEGQITDKQGAIATTQKHDVWAQFEIRDGTRRYKIKDRSLGFRWLFTFLLFTQFRAARSGGRPLVFLFDEPASNLHAAAQQKLIECFPEITRGKHTLIYTTHSHYMIEPKWLEQTFIVTNRADAPSKSVLDEISLEDESLDIKVSTYRSFVNEHPNQQSYFQPILDRLNVVPSRLDIQKSSVILEGRSDYYILRYAASLLGKAELPLIPGLGAGTFNALAALHVGWNLKFLFVPDSDKQGSIERNRYVQEFGIADERIVLLSDLASGVDVIEDLVDQVASAAIQDAIGSATVPKKPEIKRFFQERLASERVIDLGPEFRTRSLKLLKSLEERLPA